MSITTALATGPTKPTKGQTCQTCKWLAGLKPELREGAQALLDNPDYAHTQLKQEFEDDGLHVAAGSLGRHRNGHCAKA